MVACWETGAEQQTECGRGRLADGEIPPADKKCPFTGLVSIRGRILNGTVVSTKMHRTLVIRREYLHFIPKYSRYEKRHKNLAAHVSPAFRVEEGDHVTVGQCRPLSKTVCICVPRAGASAELPDSGRARNVASGQPTDMSWNSGPVQCSACHPEGGQGRQVVCQVLRWRVVSFGHSRRCFLYSGAFHYSHGFREGGHKRLAALRKNVA